MRIYIIEDDLSVIGILEDIVEGNGLGTICGDTGDGPPDLSQILALAPTLFSSTCSCRKRTAFRWCGNCGRWAQRPNLL